MINGLILYDNSVADPDPPTDPNFIRKISRGLTCWINNDPFSTYALASQPNDLILRRIFSRLSSKLTYIQCLPTLTRLKHTCRQNVLFPVPVPPAISTALCRGIPPSANNSSNPGTSVCRTDSLSFFSEASSDTAATARADISYSTQPGPICTNTWTTVKYKSIVLDPGAICTYDVGLATTRSTLMYPFRSYTPRILCSD